MGKQKCTYSFQSVYEAWLEQVNTLTPFAILEAFLSDISSYSDRIEQVKAWQIEAIDTIENEYHLDEWNNDFASYIRFCERLRELKENEITVTSESSRSNHRKELTLLMEHITPQEMIAFTSLFDRINDFYSAKRSPKYLLTYYSLIYRDNSIASIGTLDLLDFALRFTSMELLRTYSLIDHNINELLKIKPVSKSVRAEFLEIYLKERIRCMREKNSEEDDTRPYPLTDMECLQIIYQEDYTIVAAFTEIRNDKELNDKLLDDSYHSEQLNAEMQNYRLKVEQFKNAYGYSYMIPSKEEIMPIGDDLVDHMHKLMICYIRLLEEKLIGKVHVSSQDEKDPIKRAILTIYEKNLCGSPDWAVIARILEERNIKQKGDYKNHAKFINNTCGEKVTSANSISRSVLYSKIGGTYPDWFIRSGCESREMTNKLEKYKEIAEVFIAVLYA